MQTLREAVRQRIFTGLLALGFTLVLGTRFLGGFNFGAPELKFIAELGLGVVGGLGAVFAATLAGQLFLSDLESGAVQTLLARPVRRAEFVLGKMAGVTAGVTLFCGVLLPLLATLLWSREREMHRAEAVALSVNYARLAVIGLVLWGKLIVTASLALLVASYARSQALVGLCGTLLYGLGHFHALALEAAARSGSWWTRMGAAAIGGLLPDFQRLSEAAAAGAIGRVALCLGGWCAVACALAVASFERREL